MWPRWTAVGTAVRAAGRSDPRLGSLLVRRGPVDGDDGAIEEVGDLERSRRQRSLVDGASKTDSLAAGGFLRRLRAAAATLTRSPCQLELHGVGEAAPWSRLRGRSLCRRSTARRAAAVCAPPAAEYGGDGVGNARATIRARDGRLDEVVPRAASWSSAVSHDRTRAPRRRLLPCRDVAVTSGHQA